MTNSLRLVAPAPADAPAQLPQHNLGTPTDVWDYRNEAGGLMFRVARWDRPDGKDIRPAVYGDDGCWHWMAYPSPRPPYNLPRLTAEHNATVLVAEGEKAADAAQKLLPECVVTTSSGGCKAAGKSDWTTLKGRDVVIWPDNDENGQNYAQDVANYAYAAGAECVRIVQLPADIDVSDDLADDICSSEEARIHIEDAKEVSWTGTETMETQEVVEHEQGAKKTSSEKQSAQLPEPEPWPEPIDGAGLLENLVSIIENHVVLPPGGSLIVALWAILAHKFEDFYVCPRLAVNSATLGSGKTTLLKILSRLVPRPLMASNISPAAVYRAIDAYHPTLLIDEADTFLKSSPELQGILNSGHDRAGAQVVRCTGENFSPQILSTWCPMAFASIGKLTPTLESRSIVIPIERKRPDERITPIRADRMDDFDDLARKVARWAADHNLSGFDPVIPDALRNRNADNWRPFFIIADAIGGEAPDRIRSIACTLDGERELTTKEQLLGDIKVVFDDKGADKLSSQVIIDELAKMEDRPWPEWRSDKPITQRQLAAQLKPFGITPNTIRLDSNATPKGYTRAQFQNAWSRHLPPDTSATAPQPAPSNGYGDLLSATNDQAVADEEAPKTPVSNTCGGVADQNGGDGLTDSEQQRLAIRSVGWSKQV